MIENFSIMDFNYFDIAIAALVLLLGLKGFLHGFLKEMFGLIGLIGGVYFASRLSDRAATFIDQNFLHLENTSLLNLIGFIAVLLVIWLGATIVGSILSKLSSANELTFISRLLGYIAGGFKYFLIFALIATALSNVSFVKDNLDKYVSKSVLYPYLTEAGSTLINFNSSTGITKKETSKNSEINTTLTETNQSTAHQ